MKKNQKTFLSNLIQCIKIKHNFWINNFTKFIYCNYKKIESKIEAKQKRFRFAYILFWNILFKM